MKLPKLPQVKLTGTSAVNAGGAIVVVYLLVVLIQTVKHNYDMGVQIKTLQNQISLYKDQKTAQSDSLAYYQTDSYRDRQARSQLGLQAPGENVVIIPGSNTTAVNDQDTTSRPSASSQTVAPKSNFAQWVAFLTGG